MKIFTNFTDRDFTHTWDLVPYTFKAGSSVVLEDYLAIHFCKHFVDREIQRDGYQVTDPKRSEYESKCLRNPEAELSELPEEVKAMPEEVKVLNIKEQLKKAGRPKKVEEVKVKKVEEKVEEFADLKE